MFYPWKVIKHDENAFKVYGLKREDIHKLEAVVNNLTVLSEWADENSLVQMFRQGRSAKDRLGKETQVSANVVWVALATSS